MSTEETRAKSFAISTILAAIILVVCIAILIWGPAVLPRDDFSVEYKTVQFGQTDKGSAATGKEIDAFAKSAKEFKEEMRGLEEELKRLEEETKELERLMREMRKFKDEFRSLEEETKELERLMCEKGLLKGCKAI